MYGSTLMNLIINAGEAIGAQSGTVTVTTQLDTLAADAQGWWQYTGSPLAPGDYVRADVNDTGGGMSPETLARVFQPFAQEESGMARAKGGLGLGLCFMVQNTTMNTILQTKVDDAMRGRVLALYTLTFFGFAPFGNLLAGAVAQVWSLPLPVS